MLEKTSSFLKMIQPLSSLETVLLKLMLKEKAVSKDKNTTKSSDQS